MTRFLLHNLTLPAEEETGYIGVWGQRRLNYLKHHRKVLYYNLLTSGKLHSHLSNTEETCSTIFSPAGKRPCRKRKCNLRTQIHRYDALGAEDEQYQ
ncbi:MAG: TnpV protein [Eubacterium sp.]|nr:TnpV protein [uncultured Eubacterium sp.]